MTSKRRAAFLRRVAEAARLASPRKPRGRPTPANLTDAGRAKGLEAIRRAPRCRAERRRGGQCRNPALQGSTRCLKHGGRVEVPGHPHNLRRFFNGTLSGDLERITDREAWDRMSFADQRAFIAMVPQHIAAKPKILHRAARLWRQVEGDGHRAWARILAVMPRA